MTAALKFIFSKLDSCGLGMSSIEYRKAEIEEEIMLTEARHLPEK